MQRYLQAGTVPRPLKSAFLADPIAKGGDIWQQEKSWKVANLPDMFPARKIDLGVAFVANHPDATYEAAKSKARN